MINTQKILVALAVVLPLLGGCASKPPTISHIHLGHAIDGWPDTPNQEGLFVAAEIDARSALNAAKAAVEPGNTLEATKNEVKQVIHHTDPNAGTELDPNIIPEAKSVREYGVKGALAVAAHHVVFASQADDASENVKQSAQKFSDHTEVVLARCDVINALGTEILRSTSKEEANLLSEEIYALAQANVYGDDSDGDGKVGSSPEEVGFIQLRKELDKMVGRESPPYNTVDTWYLFNLIQLPTGDWILRKLGGAGADGRLRGY